MAQSQQRLRWEKYAVSVKRFQCLYYKRCSDYKDKNKKANAWREVVIEAYNGSGKVKVKSFIQSFGFKSKVLAREYYEVFCFLFEQETT